jgi:hypothetical protein
MGLSFRERGRELVAAAVDLLTTGGCEGGAHRAPMLSSAAG